MAAAQYYDAYYPGHAYSYGSYAAPYAYPAYSGAYISPYAYGYYKR